MYYPGTQKLNYYHEHVDVHDGKFVVSLLVPLFAVLAYYSLKP